MVFLWGSGQRVDSNECIGRRGYFQWIAQGSSEIFKMNFHNIAVGQFHAVAEAQAACAEIMNVEIAGVAMRFEFEMMMLDVLQAVAHLGFAGADVLRPNDFAASFDGRFSRNRLELRIDHQLWAQRAGAYLRAGEIQVILLFE